MGLLWLAIIFGVVWLVRDGLERRRPEAASENVLAILDRRFAEGAVSLEEYEQRRDVLTGAAAPSAARAVTPSASPERSERGPGRPDRTHDTWTPIPIVPT